MTILLVVALGGDGAFAQKAPSPASRSYDSLVATRPDAATPAGSRPIVVATDAGLLALTEGAAFASADGGASWERRAALGGEPVAAISVGGELRCLLRSGRVVRSSDGGTTWTPVVELAGSTSAEVICGGFAPDGAAWASLSTPKPSVAAVVAGEVRTVDGARGRVGAGFRGADGFVTASGGDVYRGDAAGADMRRVAALQGATLNDLAFADASLGWIATGEGNVLETHDGGTTWLPRPVAGASALDAVGLVGNAFWVVGRAERDGVLYVSADAGVRWRSAFAAPAPLSRPAATASAVWVVDGSGGVWSASALDAPWRRVGSVDAKASKAPKVQKAQKAQKPKGR